MNSMDAGLIAGKLGRIADALDRIAPPKQSESNADKIMRLLEACRNRPETCATKSFGEMTVNIKINKDEILRDIKDIVNVEKEAATIYELYLEKLLKRGE